MTTKIQKILSFLLALTVVFCASSAAYAVETNLKTDAAEYLYYGELSEGWNTIWEYDYEMEFTEDIYVYYNFSIPSDGYFCVNYGTPHTDMYAEIPGQYNYKVAYYLDYGYKKLYYLEKGDYVLKVDVYSSAVDVQVYTSFLGESITDITFDYDQVMNYDFDYYSDYSNEKLNFKSYASATFTFSSGKTYSFNSGLLQGTMESDFVEGINNVTVEIFQQKIPTTVTVYLISHYIADIEISNIENYYDENIIYYDGVDATYPYGETLTVTFTDGSTKSMEVNGYMYVTLSNGQDYIIDIYAYTDYFGESLFEQCCYEICIGTSTIKLYCFDGTKASLGSNIERLKGEINYYREDIAYYLKYATDNFANKEELSYGLMGAFSGMFEIYVILVDFFFYYTTFSFI